MSEETKDEVKKAAKLVKVKALRPFQALGRVINPGEIVAVDEAHARDITREVAGVYDFTGERLAGDRDFRRSSLKIAELVA